ncbi:hypothetical protein GSY74_03665, partial [Sulfurovum sp. bin170]|uniref:hypothetical protein n=1 Tax=Sulfurovum sp. bin170 TaxID=2695268 RepID=UPI0013DF2425
MYKKIATTILLMSIFSGCQVASDILHETVAPKVHSYNQSSDALKECNFDKAIDIVSKNQNELLKNSELGLAYYFKNSYQQSNQNFDNAINIYRINENKSTIALSNIVRNEYQGEGFDKVFLHNYKAINYLMLGDSESARVEAKNSNLIQQQEKLKLHKFKESYNKVDKNAHLASRYDLLFNSVNPQHHPYQNPFAYYISALGYAEDGDYDNALVDIRNAIKFGTDGFSLAQFGAKASDSKILKNKLLAYQNRDTKPTVELFFDVGQSPLKSQVQLKMDMGNGQQRMAYLPSYILEKSDIDYIKIIDSQNKEVARSSLLSDINAIKINEFKEKLPAILSILTKEATISMGSEALDKKSKLLATIFKTGSAIYGQNDVSTWSLLPEKILVISFTPKNKEL